MKKVVFVLGVLGTSYGYGMLPVDVQVEADFSPATVQSEEGNSAELAERVKVVAMPAVPMVAVTQSAIYENLDDLRRLLITTIQVEEQPDWLSCKTIDSSFRDSIAQLERALTPEQALSAGNFGRLELISDLSLRRYLSFIAQGEASTSQYFSAIMWATRERYRIPKADEHFWRVPSKFIDTLDKLMTEKAEKIESMRMTPPDYSKPTIVKEYSEPAMSSEFIAPENGYLIGSLRLRNQWGYIKVNGRVISTGKGEGIEWGNTLHMPVNVSIRKGDRFILEGGDYHTLMFFPCI